MKCGDANNPGGQFISPVTGRPCMRDVKPGFTRCNLHGAASLSAKIKAEQALAMARLPACEALFEVIERYTQVRCDKCGLPTCTVDETRTLIAACKTVLDRTGMGPHAVLEVTPQRDGPLNLDLLTDSERAQMLEALTTIRVLKATIRQRQMQAPLADTTAQPSGPATV